MVRRGGHGADAPLPTLRSWHRVAVNGAQTLELRHRKLPMDKTLEAAKAIAAARRARTPLASLAPDIAPRDEAEGYRIQDAVHALLAPEVGPLVGYKIG